LRHRALGRTQVGLCSALTMRSTRAKCLSLLRRVGADPRLLPYTALLLRARTVRETPIFLARELSGRGEEALYRLRANGLRVAIRHCTGDLVTLGEVFHDHQYSPIEVLEHKLADVRRIVDLGANIGLFGLFAAARWPAASIIAFEPDPQNAQTQRRTIAANGLAERWRLIESAAGDRDGSARFLAGQVALSRLAEEGDRGTIEVRLVDVLPYIAGADLVKIDIEGGEWAILADPRFREAPPSVLVLEYHPRRCPGSDTRAQAHAALSAAKLQIREIFHREDGHGMLWAWRG
jgi:FkbM family methyltransferase